MSQITWAMEDRVNGEQNCGLVATCVKNECEEKNRLQEQLATGGEDTICSLTGHAHASLSNSTLLPPPQSSLICYVSSHPKNINRPLQKKGDVASSLVSPQLRTVQSEFLLYGVRSTSHLRW
jgi:hypothetical protein